MSTDEVPPGLEPWFAQRLAQLARNDKSPLGHLLHTHEQPLTIANTKTMVRTHFLAFDANDRPAIDLFSTAVAGSILDFCIPRARLLEALETWQTTGSTAAISRLQHQARSLFVSSEKSGEGGELLLFMLMEQVLGVPQLISKMALKTSKSMHVHGTDGIHAAFTPNDVLELYWGESKLYKSTSSAFSECFSSIAPYLSEEGAETRDQDLFLVRQNLDLGQRELTAHLIKFFDDSEPEAMQVRFRGACLVGFDHADYPNLKLLKEGQEESLKEAVKQWHTSIEGQVGKHKLEKIDIDLFCVPFPSVEEIRKSINNSIGVTK